MKVVLINKSDSTGGAAVVSKRLVEALRDINVDARMLVVEKLSDAPYVALAASPKRAAIPFLAERLKIFCSNGFSRAELFKADTASDGLPLCRHPWVREADVVVLGWVNQGMLSLKGIRKIAAMGKPIAWIMHDMWCMTGICHHAGTCPRFGKECGDCRLLGHRSGHNDLSHRTWLRKNRLYSSVGIKFLPVSTWLERRARVSSLLGTADITTIPNPFPMPKAPVPGDYERPEVKILFGAARLDDPIKGLPYLKEAMRILAEEDPWYAERIRLLTFGEIRDASLLEDMAVKHDHLGRVNGAEALRNLYADGDIIVSTSLYETLPGTLVEGQAYGCIPVAFNRGGQSDIVTNGLTGFLVPFSDDIATGARGIAEGIRRAIDARSWEMTRLMWERANRNFNSREVALRYRAVFEEMLRRR